MRESTNWLIMRRNTSIFLELVHLEDIVLYYGFIAVNATHKMKRYKLPIKKTVQHVFHERNNCCI